MRYSTGDADVHTLHAVDCVRRSCMCTLNTSWHPSSCLPWRSRLFPRACALLMYVLTVLPSNMSKTNIPRASCSQIVGFRAHVEHWLVHFSAEQRTTHLGVLWFFN